MAHRPHPDHHARVAVAALLDGDGLVERRPLGMGESAGRGWSGSGRQRQGGREQGHRGFYPRRFHAARAGIHHLPESERPIVGFRSGESGIVQSEPGPFYSRYAHQQREKRDMRGNEFRHAFTETFRRTARGIDQKQIAGGRMRLVHQVRIVES